MKYFRLIFNIWAFIIFLVFGFLVSKIVIEANHIKQKKSAELLTLAKKETDANKKIIYLIQSDLLLGSPEKKLILAKTYLEIGQKEKAITELKGINCKEELEACDYLAQLGEISYVAQKKDLPENIRTEFKIIEELSQGKFNAISDYEKEPQTNILKLIQAVKQGNYSKIKNQIYASDKLNNLIKENSENQTTLYLANYFLDINQPNLSIYVLENNNFKSIDTYIIKSQAYYKLGSYDKAYAEILAALEIDPTNLNLYKSAFELSEKLESARNIDLLRQNYQRLLRLSQL